MSQPVDSRFAEPDVLFFGIGAQKAGTSWLHAYLYGHPDVCVPAGKEMHYWTRNETGSDFIIERYKLKLEKQRAEGRKNVRGLERRIAALETDDPTHSKYADLMFQRYDGQKAVGEITPDYARLSRKSFEFMSNLNSDTRFIFLMRDPIERVHSAIRKKLRRQAGGDRDAVIDDAQILADFERVLQKNSAMLARTRYDVTMDELEAVVPAEKIGYFFYEDIFAKRNVDDICDFLSIPRKEGDFDMRVNRGNPREQEFDPAFRDLALKHIGGIYDRVTDRFGDKVPDAWKKHLEAQPV
jgi:hypothetical protein